LQRWGKLQAYHHLSQDLHEMNLLCIDIGGTFSRFGSFIIKTRAEKTGRNISKNTTIKIPAHNIPAFKPAKVFIEGVKTNVQVK